VDYSVLGFLIVDCAVPFICSLKTLENDST